MKQRTDRLTLQMSIMERKFSILQIIFIPLMLLFFICMNMGFVKYNDSVVVCSIMLLTIGTIFCIWKFSDFIEAPLSQKSYSVSLGGGIYCFIHNSDISLSVCTISLL